MDGRLVTSGVVKFICGRLGVGNRKGVCISVHGQLERSDTPEPPTHGYMQ